MLVICNVGSLLGVYGAVVEGQQFECPDDVAKQLLAKGYVRRPLEPAMTYEVKVIEASPAPMRYETKVIQPSFSAAAHETKEGDRLAVSDGDLPDGQPAGVGTEDVAVLPGADVSESRIGHRRGRSGKRRGSIGDGAEGDQVVQAASGGDNGGDNW